uniref:Transmembrane domain-containing protein n=1 Tax=Spironucleus salmonicida TaxID=348837 RepID=V6LJY5_9EUKA|eukprot:EST44925.1 Transmembrane domain-containing protein [Spironucleus salmonicida]
MLYLYSPDEFDHQPACYITDYINSIQQFILFIHYKSLSESVNQSLVNNLQLYSAIASFMGAVTHHFFNNVKHSKFFTIFWQISVYFQILTSSSFLLILAIQNNFSTSFYVPLTVLLFVLCMTNQKFSFEIQMLISASFLLIFTFFTFLQKPLFHELILKGCAIIIASFLIIVFKIQLPYFNHNSIFHSLLFIAYFYLAKGVFLSVK